MVGSNKTGDSSWFSLNIGLVRHFFFGQRGGQASKECFEQAERIFWWPHKEIAIVVLAKVQDAVEAIEKKSSWRGETMPKKLPQCGIFHGLSITFTTWWDFQLKHVRIHISRNPKTSQDTWRKGGLCLERPEGERMFFLRKTRRNICLGETWRNRLVYPKGEWRHYLGNTWRKHLD